jgi:glycerol uptake facilitator-like aquaporin
LIELFPTAGPAMNPMLATCWDVFGVNSDFAFPIDNEHYFVYWFAPCVSAILAGIVYAVYNGDKVFGINLPIGPLKSKKDSSKKED